MNTQLLSSATIYQLATLITNGLLLKETNISPMGKVTRTFNTVLNQLTEANGKTYQHLYETLEDYGSGCVTDALYWEIADLVNTLANPK